MLALGEAAPSLENAPDDLEDFPDEFITGIEIYNKLPDRYLADAEKVIYLGKDFSIFDNLCHLYYIETIEDKRDMHYIISTIDSVNIKQRQSKK